MKKTIASIALIAASSTTMAMRPPNLPPLELKTICLTKALAEDKSIYLGSCDESKNNTKLGKKLAKNGCATGQAALATYDTVNIRACMPPGMVQL